MATNRVLGQSNKKTQLITVSAGLLSGAPYCFGDLPGVLLKDADSSNKSVMQLDGLWSLSVKAYGVTGATTALTAGQKVYYNAASTPKINADSAGKFFGYTMEVVTAAGTATVKVQVGA